MKTQKLSHFIYLGVFLLMGLSGNSQEVLGKDSKKVQVSFVYPVGSNGQRSGQISNAYSLNILAGYNGGVEAFELGGIYNVVSGDVNGAQISGFGNAVGGNVSGFQLAGFINSNKGGQQGTQIAGFTNLVGSDIKGFQLAGFTNVVKGDIVGGQVAGFTNASTSGVNGLQLAGFSNVAAKTDGAQISGFLNRTGDLEGFQLAGFVNKAKDVDGVQLGVINLADSVKSGTQIGLVNLSKNGFISLGLESDDNMPYQIAFRSGMDLLYTIIFAGIDPDEDYWSLGAGFGSRMFISDKETFFLNPELRWSQINDGKINYNRFSHLTKANLNLGYQFNRKLFITGGPSANFYVTNDLDENGQPVIDLTDNQIIDSNSRNHKHQFWIGYHVGMGFRF